MVKQMSGHSSNAVDAYQVTSEEQKRNVCEILGNTHHSGRQVDGGGVDNKEIERNSIENTLKLTQTNKSCNC